MAQIDEASRRWSDWQGGRPIMLPDGQTWFFYEPEATLRTGDDGPIPSWTFADDPLLDVTLAHKFAVILDKLGRASNPKERASATLEAAWFLLARNYRLTLDEFEAILMEAAMWDDDAQAAIGFKLGGLIDDVCGRAVALMEVI